MDVCEQGGVWKYVRETNKIKIRWGAEEPKSTREGLVRTDKLLLGERDEFSGLQKSDTLDVSGGGKSPARSARSLVLDGSDCSFGRPINGLSIFEERKVRSHPGLSEVR